MTDIDLDALFDDLPTLRGVHPFVQMLQEVRWFRALGETPTAADRRMAVAYGAALGFPEAEAAFLTDWEDAAAAAETGDFNSPAWEAEEQLRAGLTDQVLAVLDEDMLDMVATHVAESVIASVEDAAHEAAEHLRIDDGEFVRAVTGAAMQAVHQALLAMLAGADDDHPFALRFRLFERGRWPIGILGASFLVY